MANGNGRYENSQLATPRNIGTLEDDNTRPICNISVLFKTLLFCQQIPELEIQGKEGIFSRLAAPCLRLQEARRVCTTPTMLFMGLIIPPSHPTSRPIDSQLLRASIRIGVADYASQDNRYAPLIV
jgi:hypothetical protein